jgi:hypothetical protein
MSKSIVSFRTWLNISTSICYQFHICNGINHVDVVCRCLLHVHIGKDREKKFDHKANSCRACLKTFFEHNLLKNSKLCISLFRQTATAHFHILPSNSANNCSFGYMLRVFYCQISPPFSPTYSYFQFLTAHKHKIGVLSVCKYKIYKIYIFQSIYILFRTMCEPHSLVLI